MSTNNVNVNVNEVNQVNQVKIKDPIKTHNILCKYNEICNKNIMCQECAADKFESQRNEEACEKFTVVRKIDI